MEEENYQPAVTRHLSQVDNSVEEEFVTPVQVTANGVEVEHSETVETSTTTLVTEIKSTTTFSRQDTYIVDQQCNGQEIKEPENFTGIEEIEEPENCIIKEEIEEFENGIISEEIEEPENGIVSEEIEETENCKGTDEIKEPEKYTNEGEIKDTVIYKEPENKSLEDENIEDSGSANVVEDTTDTDTAIVQDENITSESESKIEVLTEMEPEDEADEANLSVSGLHRQNTYTVNTLEVKESSAQVLEMEMEVERFTETQQFVEYKYDREEQEDPLYKEPEELVAKEREVVEVRKVVEDQYVTAEEVRSQKHQRALQTTTVTEVTNRGEPILLEETSLAGLASLASLKPAEDLKDPEDGLERTSRDVDQLLKDIRDPNLDCSLDDIEAMIEGKNVSDRKEETNNRGSPGSPEFAKAAALIDQNPDPGFDPNDPAVKGLEDWDDSNNLTASFDTEGGKPSKLKNVFKRMSRTEETRSLLNESLNNNMEKHREEEEDKVSAGCFGNTLLYIFLKIFD